MHMTDKKLAAEVKRLDARIAALEKLLQRIIRQRPVSEKQLELKLKKRGLISRPETLQH
jgi:phosphate uptake regulator